jgi:LPS sulfotransferase NodH
MSYIFIGAHARSGSTYLCKLLEQVQEFRVYYEIFHFNMEVIEYHLHGDFQKIAAEMGLPTDPGLARMQLLERHRDYLAALARLNAGKVLAFKVFPGHLPLIRLENFTRESSLVLLLHRNLLQSYISNLIVKKTDRWANFDTSLEKVHFEQAGFVQHVAHVTKFNQAVDSLARRQCKKILHVHYEELLKRKGYQDTLLSEIETCLRQPMSVGSQAGRWDRQDKRSLASEKVSNPEELTAFLRQFDLLELDEAEKSVPNERYFRLLNKELSEFRG